ncbi:hypothetical protein K1719_035579 [Acacia pycnantha]|nr:hypothetical protein K1719_035579 [Acacia pycnantha]
MSKSHVLVLPFPAQGHVNPLMDLSHELEKHDIKITFANTDFIHKQIMKAQDHKEQVGSDQIQLVSISDGIEQEENRNRHEILLESIWQVMPKKLEKLIQEINNESESEKISCVVADGTMGWALEVAEKMGIRRAALFWPASASFLALFLSIPQFIHDGILDPEGTTMEDQSIHLAPEMPAMRTTNLIWSNVHFKQERATHIDHSATSFLPEDSNCLNWLDLQEDKSVIYVAFGSLAICDHIQLQELALGLELSNKPFLWAVRSDICNGANYNFLKEFEDRLFSRGKVVNWAPQQKVLSHPSIACFLSHCGWNSTIEGVINGVPFLCWPFFCDQFIDENYICDIWKIGLRFDRNNGIINREEIAYKIKKVLIDEGFRMRALQLKEKTISSVKEGGSSNKKLKNIVDWIKA